MDFLKAQFARIQEQLNGLSASQKMLTMTLVAIMAITLVYWARYAGEAEMEPVLDQTMAAEDLSRIRAYLQSKSISSRVTADNRVLVPVDRKLEILADLGYAQMLPKDTSSAFDEMIKNLSPFNSQNVNEAMFNQSKEKTLAQILRSYPSVRDANVIIDAREKRAFENSQKGSATVNLFMHNGERASKQLVNAAATLVAGSQAGLTKGRVAVIVDGQSFPVHDDDSDAGFQSDEILDKIKAYEQYNADQIRNQLSFMQGGVMVAVRVELNTTRTTDQTTTIDPKSVIQKPIEEDNHTEETNSGSNKSSGDPGTVSNTALRADSSGGGDSNNTSVDDSKIKYYVDSGRKISWSSTPAGDAKVMSASVRVPRSYFAANYKRNSGSAKDPDDATLAAAVRPDLDKIRNDVKKCTGLKTDDDVSVELYTDSLSDVPDTTNTTSSTSATSVAAVVGGHTKEIALGVLAIISLFMMNSMVRKASPAPLLARAAVEPSPAAAILMAGEALAGEAGEGNPLLDGMELDDDAVKAQQMLGQVQEMVKENPDAAANLVKRWLNR